MADPAPDLIPDAILSIRFKTTAEGGRGSPIGNAPFDYGCVFGIDGGWWDGRILVRGRLLELGAWHEVPVKFLNSELVLPKLSVGKEFTLWEGRPIGEGRVVRVVAR